ncbi:SixA phosphatase family protein [Cecembia rubra]|uniref:Phosphohistidine phosphatase n=1 Tax=Cecembia rubra TaxID=1485585 RepID=A0A2P8EDG7_9BACT|nr:histidine phosphatase family protein [Cecembia rubra]PSL07498.1 phosphohistidine phosphatase [Cecembia rubra]
MDTKKILYLLRHGEAEPGMGQVGDFDRKLTEQGKNQLMRLAKELARRKLHFDLTVCSSAKRTLETAEIMASEIPCKGTWYSPELYEADPKIILQVINQTERNFKNLMLIGHNPGISAVATFLSGDPYLNMKPGMLVILEIYLDDWASVGQNTASLIEIMQ